MNENRLTLPGQFHMDGPVAHVPKVTCPDCKGDVDPILDGMTDGEVGFCKTCFGTGLVASAHNDADAARSTSICPIYVVIDNLPTYQGERTKWTQ
jgi:hypothetical protein